MKKHMKITAGMGSVDDYIPLVNAGAEELFCGYIPLSWAEKYKLSLPLNRREVLYYNVQIGSFSEMRILRRMVQKYQVPVSITLNALYFRPEQYPILAEYVQNCIREGFTSFIVADPALLVYLERQGLSEKCRLHISGEMSEVNHLMVQKCAQLGAERVIFHRNNDPIQMKQIIAAFPKMEYEAFLLNEKCHFHGAFCNSLHCDELVHMCQVPYRIGGISTVCQERGCVSGCSEMCITAIEEREMGQNLTGESGCGLCTLWDLREAGVDYLKIVSRGNYSECTIQDVKAVKTALEILEAANTKEEYRKNMKKMLFMEGCSGNCYYPI